MNAFPGFYGSRLLGWRKLILLLLCVTVGTASITFAIITANDFRRAVLATASGSRPHISVYLPFVNVAEAVKLQRHILDIPGVLVCEPALRIEGDTQVTVRNRDGDVEFADFIPLEIVGYEFALGRPSAVAFENIYSKINRGGNPDDSPVYIISTPDPRDKGRAIVSDKLTERIFRRPMPTGNDFELGLRIKDAAGVRQIPFHARTAGAYLVNALTSSADHADAIYVRLNELQETVAMQGKVNALDIRLEDPSSAVAMMARISSAVSTAVKIVPWTKPEAESLAFLNVLNWGVLLGMAMVGGTAALCICLVLFMVVTDKMREIAVVAALGATPKLICAMFFSIGLRIGVLGAALGAATGVGLSSAVSRHQAELMSHFYARTDESILIPWKDVTMAAVCVAVLCSTAAFLPCLWALRADPIKLLAHE
jgi:ABC-type lipoprotein release transport system permease subunit